MKQTTKCQALLETNERTITIPWFCYKNNARLKRSALHKCPALLSVMRCMKKRRQITFIKCAMHDKEELGIDNRSALREQKEVEQYNDRRVSGLDWKRNEKRKKKSSMPQCRHILNTKWYHKKKFPKMKSSNLIKIFDIKIQRQSTQDYQALYLYGSGIKDQYGPVWSLGERSRSWPKKDKGGTLSTKF